MNAPGLARRLPVARRLHLLRERRVRGAETELALAQAHALACGEAVTAAEARVAEVDDRRRRLDGWFVGGLDPRHIDAALARRASLLAEREQALVLASRARSDLEAALAARAEAAGRLARAQGRLDLAASQVAACRRARAALDEAEAEAEYEDRGRRPSLLAGATA